MTRQAAWAVLRSGSDTPLREVDRVCDAFEIEGRDRGLVRTIVGAEVRRRGSLRAIVRKFAKGKPNADLCAHMHIGLVQLLFLDRIPDHAAVSETCGAVHRTLGPSKVRYVNAVLRTVLRARREGHVGDPQRDLIERPWHFEEPLFRHPEQHPYLWAEDAYSMPAAVMKRWVKRHGVERAHALARTALIEAPLSVRAVGIERDALVRELGDLGAEAQQSSHPRILVLPSSAVEEVTASAAFREGRATIQGEAAARAGDMVEARDGERILDLCAAPGGKTAQLAETGARVLALDLSEPRLERVHETCARLGVRDRVDLRVADGTGEVGDVLGATSGGFEAGAFDGALVDAPCSNSGVLAQRPGARWRLGPKSRAELGAIQAALMDRAATQVRPGGRLVWSTCSLEPEENGQRVKAFLASHPGWSLEAEHETLPGPAGSPSSGGVDSLAAPVDGGYAARLRRDP